MSKGRLLDRADVKCAICSISYVLPLGALGHLLMTSGAPSLLGLVGVVLGVMADISLCMSVLLHRFFAHRAFVTSANTQLALAWLSCLAYQMGPLWWTSKHRRHHKHCDTPLDPHSWSQLGWWRAFVGWTVDPAEQAVDREFLGSLANFPELETVDRYWFLPPAVLCHVLQWGLGVHPAYPLVAMLLCRLITLQFNCEFHPPDGEGKCKSIDLVRFLSEVVGESHHDDHHAHPSRARRPGFDVAFFVFVVPLRFLGLAKFP